MENKQQDIISEWELYMYLLKCAIRDEKLNETELEKFGHIESRQLLKRAEENEQGLLMHSYINEYAKYHKEESIKMPGNVMQVVMIYEKYKMIRHILGVAGNNNIPFIVFKGCVLADLYPQYVQRYSKDTDILVPEEYFEQAVKLMEKEGFMVNEQHTKDGVCVLVHGRAGYVIELHTCLWENYEGRKLDILKSFELTNKDSFIKLEACGIEVTTLGYEEHLIYQIFHIIKHFSLEGIGVKYLADIALYIDAYGDRINFERFWNRMEKIGYDKFSHHIFAICIEFLGMKKDILNGRSMQMGDETEEFMLDLFYNGNVSGNNYEKWQILGTMTPYFTGEKKTVKNKLIRKLAVIFPRTRDLQDHYMYAKKCPILLPVAWIHRVVNYLVKYKSKSTEWYSAGEKLEAAEHRIDLMDKMGLL